MSEQLTFTLDKEQLDLLILAVEIAIGRQHVISNNAADPSAHLHAKTNYHNLCKLKVVLTRVKP